LLKVLLGSPDISVGFLRGLSGSSWLLVFRPL
jgi:hypothetical protein